MAGFILVTSPSELMLNVSSFKYHHSSSPPPPSCNCNWETLVSGGPRMIEHCGFKIILFHLPLITFWPSLIRDIWPFLCAGASCARVRTERVNTFQNTESQQWRVGWWGRGTVYYKFQLIIFSNMNNLVRSENIYNSRDLGSGKIISSLSCSFLHKNMKHIVLRFNSKHTAHVQTTHCISSLLSRWYEVVVRVPAGRTQWEEAGHQNCV